MRFLSGRLPIAFVALGGAALTLLGLLCVIELGAWRVAQAAPPARVDATQAVSIAVTATVGIQSGACATTNTVHVLANTVVYYCFKIQHTGVSGDEDLTIHNVKASRGAIDRNLESFTLTPGEIKSIVNINSGPFITDATDVDVTNFITWTAQPADNEPIVTAYSRAYVDIVQPAVRVTKSVGQDSTICPAASTLRVPSGSDIAFCISIQNTGDITFTRYSVTDSPLGINATVNYTLAPGATLNIIPTNLSSLGISNGTLERKNVTAAFSNSASVTANGGTNLSVSGSATATVEIGTTTVRLSKTVSTDPENCSGTNSIQAQPGTMVYYCVLIENTGAFTLTHHELSESYLSIDLSFDYPLLPGQTLKVTNDFLARINQPIVFGPFEMDPKYGPVVSNVMNYEGSSPDGFSVTASAGTTGSYPPTPTVTYTPKPDPTRTSTPVPTGTPTPTFTPTPVTPSPTPTDTPVTPSPTPTISYAIVSLETPTPRGEVAGIPGAPQQDVGQNPAQPTFDPNFPGQSQSPLEQPTLPLPEQDPVLATATQIAVDATTTAMAIEATAAQVAVENAEATAFAVAQSQPESPQFESPLPEAFPASPLPTPTIDPSLAQAGIPGAVPTEMPPAPEDGVTVLPPQETVEVASATPAVVVLVVTNTPEGGEAVAAGQRPIEYPTPTPTPDFVMAAARTFDMAVTTLGWLWFLVGSLIFFITAGIMAGLFFRQAETNRFELPAPDYWLEETHPGEGGTLGADDAADDEWPTNLP